MFFTTHQKIKKNRGMTYVELIVVLGIFAVLSSVVIFNYGDFQSKVDIKNLGSDLALKIVDAQKSSLSGALPPLTQQGQIDGTWKPSYGVYFNIASGTFNLTDVHNNNFIYFTDLNQDGEFDDFSCTGSGECLDKVTITKGNIISAIDVFYPKILEPLSVTDLTITFKRPNSSPIIRSAGFTTDSLLSYVRLTITSPEGTSAFIKLYSSGRIQVD